MRKLLTLKLLGILLVLTCSMQAQQKTVEGTVTDEAGFPLAGATIAVKGTTTGASADFDGKYSLTVNENATLVVSYIGYLVQEVAVAGRTTINITLQEDVSQLDEVVVVGFGTQKKDNVSGATSFVKMDEIIADRPIVNAAEALQGVAAGLQVTNSTGQPGSNGVGINIRGFTSINGGTPLILINNVPGSINDINPSDIESISVLKDAASSSIYGARAAFGVVIITTKQAKRNEKVKFSYNTTTSISNPSDLPEKATTREFIEALNDWGERSYFAGQNVQDWLGYLDLYDSNPGQLNLIKDPVNGTTYPIHFDTATNQHYPLADSNHIDEFLNSFGYQTIHNFTIAGGGEKVAYRLGTGYSYEDGIMVTNQDNFKKYNINGLVTADIASNLVSTTNILYRSSVQSRPRASYSAAIQNRMYDPTGWFEYEPEGVILPFGSTANKVRYTVPSKTYDDNLRLFEKLEWKPIKNVSLTGEYTYEKNNVSTLSINNGQRFISTFRFNPETLAENVFTNTSLARSKNQRVYNGLNLYAKYNVSLGDHNINVLAGLNRESESFESLSTSRNGLIDPTTATFELAEGENFDISESFYDWAVVGYFGRLNYNYKERYFAEANLRYDGSSIFDEGDRYVLLPSFSVAWNVAKEPFMQNVDFISMLKPRASWGEIGNQIARKLNGSRDYYPFNPGYESFFASWTNLETDLRYLTFNPAQLISAGLTWERVISSNIGLDLRMFKNRLSTSFEIYKRETIGMLAAGQPLPDILGTAAPFQNVADLETKGWEVEVGWNDRIGDLTYNINVNLFDNTSKITKFDNPGGLIGRNYVGREIGEIWGYVTDGYYTADDFVPGTLNADLEGPNRELKPGVPTFIGNTPYPGDVKFKDLDGDGYIAAGNSSLITELDDQGNPVVNADGVITTGLGDRKVIGNNQKHYQFGINGAVQYKGFDVSFVLSGVAKEDGNRNSDLIWPFRGGFDHIYKHQLDYWTPDNQDAYYPRMYGDASNGNTGGNYGRNRRTQTKYLSDESYLRIQNITFGYSLDGKLLDKLNIDKLRVFVSGNNIHTFDKLPKGLDPDQSSNGVYPIMTRYSMGINLSF
ncbi:TonB-dependent receptor [Sabulilitoribacter arenilitoris]|uniref:TonB-dependent receptor n=1 Tax=Wocania arenilitoris TaxID=2044858 RepID=A0AAE3JNW6_9FLAO|nr:TonB-dependent receptor [Wocania arenilitoris]MCF7567640.1 TonB-dependent receptor [Wocania arenilitoris]